PAPPVIHPPGHLDLPAGWAMIGTLEMPEGVVVVRRSAVLGACLGVAGAVLGVIRPAGADTRKAEWSDTGLVSLVLTAGNSDSRTGGITNTLGRVRGKSSCELQTRGYRVGSGPRY